MFNFTQSESAIFLQKANRLQLRCKRFCTGNISKKILTYIKDTEYANTTADKIRMHS